MVLVALFALLALFSIVAIVTSAEEPGRSTDPRDNPLLWSTLSRR